MIGLEARGLCRRFGGVAALEEVSLTAAGGEITAVVGPNGSGKSTLLNVLSGLEVVDAGRILLDGREATGWSAARLARHGVTRTFQDARLLERASVLDNVLLGLHAAADGMGALRGSLPGQARRRRRRAMSTLREVRLEELWAVRAATLSHGQRRRAELARALVGLPRLLALDEPTAGLAADDVVVVGDLILGARDRGAAILLVEHDLDIVASLATAVVVLDAGRIVGAGAPGAVLADPSIRRLLGVTDDVIDALTATA